MSARARRIIITSLVRRGLAVQRMPNGPAEWLMLLPFGVFCFVFPFGTVLLSMDWMPFGMEWMSSLLLAMLGLSSAGWMWVNYGRAGLFSSAAIFALGVALEYVGVQTGFPFGSYRYTGVLVPDLFGGVPVAIGFAWVLIVVGGLFTAHWLALTLHKKVIAPALLALLGAVLAVGLDLLLEPVAFHIKGYWQWLGGGDGYYGIPWSNFLAWFVAALLMNLLVAVSLGLRRPLRWAWLPVALYAMNVIMFGIVNISHGYWVPGLVALLLLGSLALASRAHARNVTAAS